VVDALGFLGIKHIDMPCTPERVWTAIQDAKAGKHQRLWSDPPPVFDSLVASLQGIGVEKAAGV